MSTRKAVSIGFVIALHALIGYAFITGLAMNVIKKAAEDLKVVDIKEAEPPPPEEPPPPPPETPKVVPPPPVVSPPPIVRTPTIAPPSVSTVRVAPPVVITPTAPPAPPAPPPPVVPTISKAAGPKGDAAQWFSQDDYPPAALRNDEQGTTVVAWTINTQGRVENCHVTQSSGSASLDDQTCKLLVRRGRFSPAQDQAGNPIASTSTRRVKWTLPAN